MTIAELATPDNVDEHMRAALRCEAIFAIASAAAAGEASLEALAAIGAAECTLEECDL